MAGWCENLYRAKAADLLLYGRALGLSHSEAEDVLQAYALIDTFSQLLRAKALELVLQSPLANAKR